MKSAAFEALAQSKIVREYEEAFWKATGLPLKLVPEGVPDKRHSLGPGENPFCAQVSRLTGGCEACLKAQQEAMKKLGKKLAPQHVRCFAGLTDVAVPVIIGGQHIATLLSAQVFQRQPTKQDFANLTTKLIAWGLDTDLHQLEEAYFHTRVVTEEQFRAMIRLLTLFAHHLAEFGSRCIMAARHNEPVPVARAKEYVKDHSTDHVTMRGAAEYVHLSAFYFCKMFKKATGMTFTEYVSRVRIEKAKNLLANPHARVSEVAFASGFQSIPHFNRVFRRYAGMAPRQYRLALQS
ncbi:MAG: PocR ligand-binding domain-containing protein [Verrucomicrobiia bacterium]